MREHPTTFRDFGLLPVDLQPPSGKFRSFLSCGRVAGQYIGTGIVAVLGVGFVLLCALTLPLPLNLLGCAAALAGFGAFVYLATRNDYRWVELDGTTLRARHLYTGRTIERPVEEIESLRTLYARVRRLETIVVEKIVGRVRGVEIRFRDWRTPLRIMRSSPAMTNAQELIEAVLYRMTQVRELDAEVVQVGGQPLVGIVHWKGDAPRNSSRTNRNLILGCLIGLGLMLGMGLGYLGVQVQQRRVLASVPPQGIPLASLIQNGPGANRHVTVTDFRPGGYVVTENQNHSWQSVSVALFPPGPLPKEINAILTSNSVIDEAALRGLLQGGRVTGICSETPRSTWVQLQEANKGLPVLSAWEIDELRQAPSAAGVNRCLGASAGCFAAVLLSALIVFKKEG